MRPRLRQARAGRVSLVAAAAACLLAGTGLTSTGAALTATTSTTGSWATGGLAPPTGLTVSQACQAAPAPERRGHTFTSGDGSDTLVLTTPSGVAAGDVLLAGITWYAGGAIPAPSGWTLVRQELANPQTQAVFYRVVGASEPATHTWRHEVENKAGGIVAYRGVDPASLALASGSTGQFTKAAAGTLTAPSLTTRRPGTVVVGYFSLVGLHPITADSRMVSLYGTSSSGNGRSGQVTVRAAEELRPATGATGDRVSTASAGSQTAGQLVALEPPLQPHATATWTRSPTSAATGQLYRRSVGSVVQREVTLPASATSTVDGPLVAGTAYRAEVRATKDSTSSAPAEVTFTARTCTDA